MNGLVFRIGGEGGEGVISTGELLTLACARAGYDIYAYKTYPAEIKGGYAMWQVRVKDELLLSQGDKVDVLICFNQESYDRDSRDIADNGVLLYDVDQCPKVKENTPYQKYGIPFSKLAVEKIGSKRSKNVLILGIISGLFDFHLEIMEEMVRQKWHHKGDTVVQKNLDALRFGFEYVKENLTFSLSLKIPKLDKEPTMVLSGNESICLGAILAGLKYYAGYPITPASDIMEWLSEKLPALDGTVIQTEDEISALASVLGASYAGAKSMTATSGPGLSLMCELIGLASMAEIPAVIVDVQRGGPSTGMPTKVEQSDLNLALYGAHGDSPRVVMALSSVEDCFYGIIRAINIAERTQLPVIVLSDQYLAQRKASMRIPDLTHIEFETRLEPDPAEQSSDYKRYALTESGISPMAIPGKHPYGYVATGIEHEETAKPGYSRKLHDDMTNKRFKKLKTVHEDSNKYVKFYGEPQPEVGIIGWGSSEGVIREAVKIANANGMKVAALHPKIISPLPYRSIDEFLALTKKVIVPEMNYTGQFANYLMAWHDIKPIRLNKYQGMPFTPDDILAKIEEVYGKTHIKETHSPFYSVPE